MINLTLISYWFGIFLKALFLCKIMIMGLGMLGVWTDDTKAEKIIDKLLDVSIATLGIIIFLGVAISIVTL